MTPEHELDTLRRLVEMTPADLWGEILQLRADLSAVRAQLSSAQLRLAILRRLGDSLDLGPEEE